MNCVTASQTILIVDDSDDDYDATVRALSKGTNLRNPIHRCENGQEALDYLHRRGAYAQPDTAPRPGLILLDLNMPGIDGRKVLQEMDSVVELRRIPTVVMTNSDDERDIDVCYELGANTYVRKPLNWNGFFEAMTRLKEYWFEIALLPKS
ncbi:MAG: response regulator [Alphaproteobacteria bacterium]